MALKPCRECGKEVSTEAKVCPHCGISAPVKNARPSVKAIICGIIVLLIGAIWLFSGPSETPAPSQAGSDGGKTQGAQTADASSSQAPSAQQAAPPLPTHYKAIFTCGFNGPTGVSAFPVLACFQGESGDSGRLEITSDGNDTIYTNIPLKQEFAGPTAEFSLSTHFLVSAQPEGQSGFVLSLVIKDDAGNTVFQKQATEYDSIVVRN